MGNLTFFLPNSLGGEDDPVIPLAVPAPQPGDPNYRDHAARALSRLLEQFKAKQL